VAYELNSAFYAIKMLLSHTLPGGWIGLLMMIVTVLSLISDLAVAGLVKAIAVPSRCNFGSGLVINQAKAPMVHPSPNGAVFLATQAQMTSANNTGLEGIYRKVNNATNFRADRQDILGAWKCADQGMLTFDGAHHSPQNIVDALFSKGYLFTNSPGGEAITASGGTDFWTKAGNSKLAFWWAISSPRLDRYDSKYERRCANVELPLHNERNRSGVYSKFNV